jgi:hypothetical protein
MAMTATERSRVARERREHGKVVLTVVVGEDKLAEIRQGRLRRGSLDRSQEQGSGGQLVPERHGLGDNANDVGDPAIWRLEEPPAPLPVTFVGQPLL